MRINAREYQNVSFKQELCHLCRGVFDWVTQCDINKALRMKNVFGKEVESEKELFQCHSIRKRNVKKAECLLGP